MKEVFTKLVFYLILGIFISGCSHQLMPGEYHSGRDGKIDFAGEKVIIFNKDSASVFCWTDNHTIQDGVYFGNIFGTGLLDKKGNTVEITFGETPIRESDIKVTSRITAEENAGHDIYIKSFDATPIMFATIHHYDNKDNLLESIISDIEGKALVQSNNKDLSYLKVETMLYEDIIVNVEGFSPSRFDITAAERLNYFKRGETRSYKLGKQKGLHILRRNGKEGKILKMIEKR